jgi:thioredoxin-like negative regulator of GroEL
MSTMPPAAFDRTAAARLLRAAATPGPGRSEQVEWAFWTLPDSRPARRLQIESLIDQGDREAALALIGQGLLRRPTDPALALLRARCLFDAGDSERAEGAIKIALARRPEHTRTLELAGRVALERGDAHRAAAYFRRIDLRRPSARSKRLRVIALLRCRRPDLAHQVLRQMERPPTLLEAQVLRVQGRFLEAIDLLAAARGRTEGRERGRITCGLIEVLEEAGESARLRTVLSNLSAEEPEALARGGLAWLGEGEFPAAIRAMRPIVAHPSLRGRALAVTMVAAAMINRRGLAERAISRLRRLRRTVGRETIAEAWSRGLFGGLLLDQRSAQRAGADPHPGPLPRLIREAGRVLDRALEVPEALSPARRSRLEAQRLACRDLATTFE